MNSVMLIDRNIKSKDEIIRYLRKNNFKIFICEKPEDAINLALQHKPDLYLVSLESDTSVQSINLIKDIRIMMGLHSVILTLGKSVSNEILTHIIEVGANDNISLPFDSVIFDTIIDQYRSSLTQTSRLKYRALPSGGQQLTLDINIEIEKIDREGITFYSENLFSKSTIFSLNRSQSLPEINGPAIIKFKVISNWVENEDSYFGHIATFYDLGSEESGQIIKSLKELKKR